jgi:hypothetical protein
MIAYDYVTLPTTMCELQTGLITQFWDVASCFAEARQELTKPVRGTAARGVVGVRDPVPADSRDGVIMQGDTSDALVMCVCTRFRGVGAIGAEASRRRLCSIHG